MKRAVCVIMVGVSLAACNTTEQAAVALRSKWDGKPADQFFVANGPPASSYDMASGGKIFTWAGGHASVALPGTATTTTNLVGATAFSTTTYDDGVILHLGCRVEIVTDKAGLIATIKPIGDTMGMWQLSRCAEIFGGSQ